jgi:hypothetical protein
MKACSPLSQTFIGVSYVAFALHVRLNFRLRPFIVGRASLRRQLLHQSMRVVTSIVLWQGRGSFARLTESGHAVLKKATKTRTSYL